MVRHLTHSGYLSLCVLDRLYVQVEGALRDSETLSTNAQATWQQTLSSYKSDITSGRITPWVKLCIGMQLHMVLFEVTAVLDGLIIVPGNWYNR